MRVEWDNGKAEANLRRHGVSFEEAATVLLDPLSATGEDPDHSVGEHRFITFGMTASGKLLAVAHTERRGAMRIISARAATRAEKRIYEEE